jgi:hypothetical protein
MGEGKTKMSETETAEKAQEDSPKTVVWEELGFLFSGLYEYCTPPLPASETGDYVGIRANTESLGPGRHIFEIDALRFVNGLCVAAASRKLLAAGRWLWIPTFRGAF